MRTTLCVLSALALASSAAAQMPAMNHDATTQVKGSGVLPTGWMMRYDPQRDGSTPAPDAVKVVTMGPGLHFTSGPAAIYYNTKDMGSGEYLVTATISQRKSMNHEAYGIFIGGRNLQDSTQTYTYFVVKPCHSKCGTAGLTLGEALISQRSSNGKPVALMPLTHFDAINTDDPTDGHATNKFQIHVAKDSVHFLLNDKLIKGFSKAEIGNTDGLAGLRINHNIDVHVDWKGVTK